MAKKSKKGKTVKASKKPSHKFKIHKIDILQLSALAFILISTSALALGSPGRVVPEKPIQKQAKIYPDLPVLGAADNFPILSARGALAIDLDSGVTLFERQADIPYLPASTTKIITALVAMDHYQMNQVIEIGNGFIEGHKMGLVAGEQITVRSLLDGLLIYSANDAAEAFAREFPGGREEFILAMNKKAEEFHLTNTFFTNPAGLDGNKQVTTARDLIRIAQEAMKIPLFAEIVGTEEKVVTSVDEKIIHRLENINELVGEIDGVLGVKTGWTENARENLVTYINRDGRTVMIAILGSQDRFGETRELINWVFTNYSWEKVGPKN